MNHKKIMKAISKGRLHLKYSIQDFEDTDSRYSDMVDSLAYSMTALKMCEQIDSYCLALIRPKPRFVPSFIWLWILKKTFELGYFKKIK